jgi:type VI secretion system protein ImpA
VKLGGDAAGFTLNDWQRPPAEVEEGAPSREALLARMSLVGAASWADLDDALDRVRAAVSAFDHAASRLAAAPTLRATDEALRAMQGLAREALRAAGGRPAAAPNAPADRTPPVAAPEGAEVRARAGDAVSPGGPISSRAEAYQRLMEAADYLLRTEPHSPVPYLVKRAISWGNMPLTELLQEFISGADDLVTTHRLLGMRSREE